MQLLELSLQPGKVLAWVRQVSDQTVMLVPHQGVEANLPQAMPVLAAVVTTFKGSQKLLHTKNYVLQKITWN